MSLDISRIDGLDTNARLQALQKVATSSSGLDTTSSAEFRQLLSDATATLAEQSDALTRAKEAQGLVDALDKSILGKVAANLDVNDLASDLLGSKGGSDVVSELIGGHFSGIVMSPAEDNENSSDTIASSISKSLRTSKSAGDESPYAGLEDTTTETLADKLEAIMASLGQIST